MFATLRPLLSCVLISMTILALTSGIAEAKHVKSSHGKVETWSHTSVQANVSVSVHSSFKYNSGEWFHGNKMGLAGGQSLGLLDNVGWFYDWTCTPYTNEVAKKRKLDAVAMFWGMGKCDHDDDKKRYRDCIHMKCGEYPYVAFLNEFDISGDSMSGGLSLQETLDGWEKYVVPHRACGSKLIGPSCAMGTAEKRCTEWYKKVKTKPDAVSVHVFAKDLPGVQALIGHYVKFGLPIIVTEMACIDYSQKPAYFCRPGEITAWFKATTDYFEKHASIVGYAVSDANNGEHAKFTENGEGRTLTFLGNLLKGLFRSLNKRSLEDAPQSKRMVYRRR